MRVNLRVMRVVVVVVLGFLLFFVIFFFFHNPSPPLYIEVIVKLSLIKYRAPRSFFSLDGKMTSLAAYFLFFFAMECSILFPSLMRELRYHFLLDLSQARSGLVRHNMQTVRVI